MTKRKIDLGAEIVSGLKEAVAHSRGEIALESRIVDPMPAARVKKIVRAVAKSPKQFSARFGIPARTIEGWEQGKKIDVAGRVLLKVIERNPEAVEQALAGR